MWVSEWNDDEDCEKWNIHEVTEKTRILNKIEWEKNKKYGHWRIMGHEKERIQ